MTTPLQQAQTALAAHNTRTCPDCWLPGVCYVAWRLREAVRAASGERVDREGWLSEGEGGEVVA